jgi:hypothetical protein
LWPPASTARPQPRTASTVCREHKDIISSPAQNSLHVYVSFSRSNNSPPLWQLRVHYCVRWSSSWVALANTQLAMKFFTFYDYERRGSKRKLQKIVPLRIITVNPFLCLFVLPSAYLSDHPLMPHPSINPSHACVQATIHPASHLEAHDVMWTGFL